MKYFRLIKLPLALALLLPAGAVLADGNNKSGPLELDSTVVKMDI